MSVSSSGKTYKRTHTKAVRLQIKMLLQEAERFLLREPAVPCGFASTAYVSFCRIAHRPEQTRTRLAQSNFVSAVVQLMSMFTALLLLRRLFLKPSQIRQLHSSVLFCTQTLHVCHICLHWGGFGGQCRHIWHTWSVWGMFCIRSIRIHLWTLPPPPGRGPKAWMEYPRSSKT